MELPPLMPRLWNV